MNSTRYLVVASTLILCAGLASSPVLAPPASAEAWSNVTVVSTDGWEYQNMFVESDAGQTYVTLLNSTGGRKRVPRSSIRVILDPDGKDITAAVLSGTEGAPADISRSNKAEGTSPHAASQGREDASPPAVLPGKWGAGRSRPGLGFGPRGPRFRFSPIFAFGVSAVSGDWFDGLSSGRSGHVAVRAAPSDNSSLGLSYRYQKLTVEPELRGPIIIDDGYGREVVVTPNWDVDLREIFFLMGFMTRPARYDIPILYLDLGLGAIQHNLGLTLTLPDGRSSSATTQETKFAMLLGAGTVIPLGRSVGLDLGGSVRLTGEGMGSAGSYRDSSTLGFLYGGHLGLAFLFGG